MAPSSTIHFSWPLFFHQERSLPLKREIQSEAREMREAQMRTSARRRRAIKSGVFTYFVVDRVVSERGHLITTKKSEKAAGRIGREEKCDGRAAEVESRNLVLGGEEIGRAHV